jgi:hypothetical protein
MKSQIMYIECKAGRLTGLARIGQVMFSQSGRTTYYGGKAFQRVRGYKANYVDVETGEEYWISGCKKDGDDTLYPDIVEIDEDVREEYWLKIRNRPDCVELNSIRSEGKYSKRRPR